MNTCVVEKTFDKDSLLLLLFLFEKLFLLLALAEKKLKLVKFLFDFFIDFSVLNKFVFEFELDVLELKSLKLLFCLFLL